MTFVLRAVAGLVVAFLIQAVLPAGFYQMVSQPILDAAGWAPGSTPPTDYMVLSVLASLAACGLAGVAAAVIIGRARFRHAVVCGAVFTLLAMWANWSTLTDSPHPYEWPLVLAPLLAMPFGAWLVMRARPLTPSLATQPREALGHHPS